MASFARGQQRKRAACFPFFFFSRALSRQSVVSVLLLAQSRTIASQRRKREFSFFFFSFLFFFFRPDPRIIQASISVTKNTTSRTAFLYDFYTPKHACLNLLSCRSGQRQQAGAPRFFNGGVSGLNVHILLFITGPWQAVFSGEKPRPREMNVT